MTQRVIRNGGQPIPDNFQSSDFDPYQDSPYLKHLELSAQAKKDTHDCIEAFLASILPVFGKDHWFWL